MAKVRGLQPKEVITSLKVMLEAIDGLGGTPEIKAEVLGMAETLPRKVTLWHSTILENMASIADKGLVPGYSSPPGQNWEGEYSGKGIYFHTRFPEHDLEQNMHMYDFNSEEECFAAVVTFEVELLLTQDNYHRLIPEEESTYNYQKDSLFAGLASYTIGEAVVWLGEVPPKCIKSVWVPSHMNVQWVAEQQLHGKACVIKLFEE